MICGGDGADGRVNECSLEKIAVNVRVDDQIGLVFNFMYQLISRFDRCMSYKNNVKKETSSHLLFLIN